METSERSAAAAAAPESGSAPPPHAHAGWSAFLLPLGAYALFRCILGLIQLPRATPGWVLLAAFVVSACGGIGLPIAAIAGMVRVHRTPGRALALAGGALALWLVLGFALPPVRGPLGVVAGTAQDLAMIVAVAGVGVALGSLFREPNILLPAGLFAAFADFVVVKFGTVHRALSTPKGQALVQAVSAKVPAMHPGIPLLTIGPADFLFLGFFLACAHRFEMGLARTARVLGIVLALSLILVPVIGAVPALAPMSIAFVVANWRRFRLTREELVSTAVVLVLCGALFAGYFLWINPPKR